MRARAQGKPDAKKCSARRAQARARRASRVAAPSLPAHERVDAAVPHDQKSAYRSLHHIFRVLLLMLRVLHEAVQGQQQAAEKVCTAPPHTCRGWSRLLVVVRYILDIWLDRHAEADSADAHHPAPRAVHASAVSAALAPRGMRKQYVPARRSRASRVSVCVHEAGGRGHGALRASFPAHPSAA